MNWKTIGSIILAIIVIIILVYRPHGDFREPNSVPSGSPIGSSTSVSIEKKTVVSSKRTGETEPDLEVSTKYVTKVNDKYIEVPTKTTYDRSTDKVIVRQEVEIPNVFKKNWEVGVGVSSDIEPVVSLQRNYKVDKAIELIVIIDKEQGKVSKGVLMHKWKF